MSDRPTPETDAMEYRFINHDSCAGESLERVIDDKDVTWDEVFRGDACPSDFARRLERQRDELLESIENLLQHRPRADWEGLTIAEGLAWDDAEDLISSVKGGSHE
jgi:hypothetical protein